MSEEAIDLESEYQKLLDDIARPEIESELKKLGLEGYEIVNRFVLQSPEGGYLVEMPTGVMSVQLEPKGEIIAEGTKFKRWYKTGQTKPANRAINISNVSGGTIKIGGFIDGKSELGHIKSSDKMTLEVEKGTKLEIAKNNDALEFSLH